MTDSGKIVATLLDIGMVLGALMWAMVSFVHEHIHILVGWQ
jgi:hypothetical protein